jgi:hypothetical protein
MPNWTSLQTLPEPAPAVKRQKYVPDLRGFMRLCEDNYRLILNLFPQWQSAASASSHWSDADAMQIQLCCQVLERTPYTLLLQFDQQPVIEPWVKSLSMQVRLYHDARMAEVVLFQHQRPRVPQQPGVDPVVHSIDEKNQSNHFLHEWLLYCLMHQSAGVLR